MFYFFFIFTFFIFFFLSTLICVVCYGDHVRLKMIIINALVVARAPSTDCEHFGIEPPAFELAAEVSAELERYNDTWGLCEEFKAGLKAFEDEDWLSFRSADHPWPTAIALWNRLSPKIFFIFQTCRCGLKAFEDEDWLSVRSADHL